MASPISALELEPLDLVREVSPEAITFYVDELSGIYLPEEFKKAHPDITDVEYWKPEDRLRGKFARYILAYREPDEDRPELDDILLMGSTVGLTGLDQYKHMDSLRHRNLDSTLGFVMHEHGLAGREISSRGIDYGATEIVLGEDGQVKAFKVSGASFDYGRSGPEGRVHTCDLFRRILGETVEIENVDPEPESWEQVIKPR